MVIAVILIITIPCLLMGVYGSVCNWLEDKRRKQADEEMAQYFRGRAESMRPPDD